jgi:signal peptidase I
MSVQTGTKKKESGWAETVRVVFHALIIALVIRTFLFQPFNIPSGSMIPTLLVGDYLFVSKYSYGFTHYSFPFSPPIFSGRRRMTRSITSSAWSGFLATRSR